MASCASDGTTGFGPGNRQNKQSIHIQTMMKKGWNRWSTQKNQRDVGRSSKGGMDLLGSARLWLWRIDLLGSVWNGYGKVLLVVEEKGVLGPQCSPPNTTRSTRLFLCVGVTEPLPFLPSGQAMETRAHKQTTCPGNHPRSTPQKPMFRTLVTCSRIHQGMDPDGLENRCSLQKKSPKKPINSLGEESTDDPHTVRQQHRRLHTVRLQSDISTTGQRQMGPPRVTAMG